MRNSGSILAVSAVCLFMLGAGSASAQQKSGGLVCWKDKSGKTVGCGDKVPPEYQDNAATTLNKRGETVKQSDAALTPEQKQAQAAAVEQKKLDAKNLEEEKRRDRALLDSFTNEKEIDLKRARDIQQLEITISAQQSHSKSLSERQTETRAKIDELKKANKPVPPQLQQELDRLTSEFDKSQTQITQKRKEIAEKTVEYDAMRKRFVELKSGTATPAKK